MFLLIHVSLNHVSFIPTMCFIESKTSKLSIQRHFIFRIYTHQFITVSISRNWEMADLKFKMAEGADSFQTDNVLAANPPPVAADPPVPVSNLIVAS